MCILYNIITVEDSNTHFYFSITVHYNTIIVVDIRRTTTEGQWNTRFELQLIVSREPFASYDHYYHYY